MQPGETALFTLRLLGTLAAATTRALAADLRQAQADGQEYRRVQKAFFAKFDAALDLASPGPRYFENEKIAEALAGEIMMLEETGIVVCGFAILPVAAWPLPKRSTCCTSAPRPLAAASCAPSCRPKRCFGSPAGTTTPWPMPPSWRASWPTWVASRGGPAYPSGTRSGRTYSAYKLASCAELIKNP